MLVIGVDGVRFDLLGPEVTPVIWGVGQNGFLGRCPSTWAATAGPGIRPASPPLITRQTQVAPLVLAAVGDITWC